MVVDKDSVKASSALHAYTLYRSDVLKKNGKRVGTLEKGLVIRYKRDLSGKISFTYYGKTRYIASRSLVLNKELKSFVLRNKNLFNYKATAIRKSSVFKDKGYKKVMMTINSGTNFAVFATANNGRSIKVQADGKFGYVDRNDFKVSVYIDVTEFYKPSGKTKRDKLVNYAKKFVGNPYVWGGTSLTSGCDCSGFVQGVYRRFGYNLPRCSKDQSLVGKKVSFSALKPGDLIFYKRGGKIGHVTLYIGNGLVVQARGAAYGIVITRYDYNKPAWARRIIN